MPYVRALYALASHLVDADLLCEEVASSSAFTAVPPRPDESPLERGRWILHAIECALWRIDVRDKLVGRIGRKRPDLETMVCWCEHALDGHSLAEVGERLNSHYDHDLDQATIRERLWINRDRYTKKSRGAISNLVRFIEQELGSPLQASAAEPRREPSIFLNKPLAVSSIYVNEDIEVAAETLDEDNNEQLIAERLGMGMQNTLSRYIHEPGYREAVRVFQLLTEEQMGELAEYAREHYLRGSSAGPDSDPE